MTKEEYEADLAMARIGRSEYEANPHWNKQDARYRFAASLLFAHAENERLRRNQRTHGTEEICAYEFDGKRVCYADCKDDFDTCDMKEVCPIARAALGGDDVSARHFMIGIISGVWITVCLAVFAATFVDWSTVRFHT